MAHQSLYRRYRSQNFSELVGQSHVTTGLRKAIAEGRESHAYLFSGPRGTGKTSTARILAKALNCENVTDGEPCGECESCQAIEHGQSFDLHELDAASHNKVDDIRELISRVNLGSPGRTKVYILDEVHMLSSGAENALLKTLEEPPEHVVFVLATTEPHKVVPTIRSRTQHFEFHLLPAEELMAHVRFVIEDAGLDVDDEAIDWVLTQGGGSARDTLSALDLVAAAGGVPAGSDTGLELARAIGADDAGAAMAAVQNGLTTGQEPRTIGEDTTELLRNAFLAAMGTDLTHLNDRAREVATELAAALGPAKLTRGLEAIGQALVEMRQAPDPRIPLEVCLLQLCRAPGPLTSVQGDDTGAPAATGDDPRIAKLQQQVAALEQRVAELASNPAAAATTTTAPSHNQAPSAPAADEPARQDGPAAAARERLSEITAKAPPSPRAKRRNAEPAANSSDGAPSGPSADTPTEPASPPPAEPAPTAEAAPEPTPASEAAPAPEPNDAAATGRPALTSALTLDSVTTAFADQLGQVRQKVRVRFKGGQVLGVEGSTITFGVPQAIVRDRCLDVKGELEEALSAHFGQAVTIDVVVDASGPAPTMDPARIDATPAKALPDVEDEADIGPVEELADATEQSADGVERLTKAFPGSTVVESKSEQE